MNLEGDNCGGLIISQPKYTSILASGLFSGAGDASTLDIERVTMASAPMQIPFPTQP
jgi:hypothetical protein